MKPTVCVDFDGVLARYDGWKGSDHFGDPLPGAVEFTRRLAERCRVVVFTTRAKADPFTQGAYKPDGEVDPDRRGRSPEELALLVDAWLNRHGFAFDEVYIGQGKPLAAAYVDDRAVSVPTNPAPLYFDAALDRVRQLCGGH